MHIIQGSNLPVIVEFDSNVSNLVDIHVAIFNTSSETVKHWNKEDIVIDDNLAVCPLTQEETLSFVPGQCTLEVKWMEIDGYVYLSSIIPLTILPRNDKHIIGDENNG